MRHLLQVFASEWLASPRRVAGVMTGTSLDGIDIAVVDFPSQMEKRDSARPTLHATFSFPFDSTVRRDLHNALSSALTVAEFSRLRFQYSSAIAAALTHTMKTCTDIDACAVHGQTLYHAPSSEHPRTLQILDAALIATRTNLLTIHDFRSADVALGGQGAPLVPVADKWLFGELGTSIDVINIGGIANITSLGANGSIAAWDTGPGNCLIDEYVQQHFNVPFDKDGAIALQGNVNVTLLAALLKHEYFARKAPKSTGREEFHSNWLDSVLKNSRLELEHADVLRTLVELTTTTIAKAVSPAADTVYIAGGGAYNNTIMNSLREHIDKPIATTDTCGVPVASREAMCFAVLGWLRCAGKVNVAKSVTGASADSCSGSLTFPTAVE